MSSSSTGGFEDDDEQQQQQQQQQQLQLFQQRQVLKLSLLFKAKDAKRGFDASNEQRKEITDIIQQLAHLNPTKEPAAAYYTKEDKKKTNFLEKNDKEQNSKSESESESTAIKPTIEGKWTLVYTNAPDITSLDPSLSSSNRILPSPPPAAKLGRIGQHCICDNDGDGNGDGNECTISNVIEWKRPDWLGNIANIRQTNNGVDGDGDDNNNDNDQGRVLQKVVCEAKSYPDKPFDVNLQLVGFELVGKSKSEGGGGLGSGLGLPSIASLIDEGPAAIFSRNPVNLRGPLKAPFGKFVIQYLDEDMRIIKTGQGYYAVNLRESQPWF